MHRCRPDRWSPTFLAAQRYIIQPHTVKRWVGWWGWRGGGGVMLVSHRSTWLPSCCLGYLNSARRRCSRTGAEPQAIWYPNKGWGGPMETSSSLIAAGLDLNLSLFFLVVAGGWGGLFHQVLMRMKYSKPQPSSDLNARPNGSTGRQIRAVLLQTSVSMCVRNFL